MDACLSFHISVCLFVCLTVLFVCLFVVDDWTGTGTYFEASTEELALYRSVSQSVSLLVCVHILSLSHRIGIYVPLLCVSVIHLLPYAILGPVMGPTSVERFSAEINTLLEITLRSRLVEKLCVAMYSCLFDVMDDDGQEVEVPHHPLPLPYHGYQTTPHHTLSQRYHALHTTDYVMSSRHPLYHHCISAPSPPCPPPLFVV